MVQQIQPNPVVTKPVVAKPVVQKPATQPVQGQVGASVGEDSIWTKWWIWVIIAVVIIGIGIGTYLLFS